MRDDKFTTFIAHLEHITNVGQAKKGSARMFLSLLQPGGDNDGDKYLLADNKIFGFHCEEKVELT